MYIYEKVYENTYDTKERRSRSWKKENIKIGFGLTVEEYIDVQRQNWLALTSELYHNIFQMIWINSLFTYKGCSTGHARLVAGYLRSVKAGIFQSTNTVSYDTRTIARWVINNYFENFYTTNIFDDLDKYKWPFKHITPEMILSVKSIHYGKELIDYAEENAMGYGKFMDFITNQVQCRCNDSSLIEQKYEIRHTSKGGTYFTKIINYEEREKRKKADARNLRQRNSRKAQKRRLQAEAIAKRNEDNKRSKEAKRNDRRANSSGSLQNAGQDGNEEGLSQSTSG